MGRMRSGPRSGVAVHVPAFVGLSGSVRFVLLCCTRLLVLSDHSRRPAVFGRLVGLLHRPFGLWACEAVCDGGGHA